MKGKATCHGGATIVNAMANGKGAAFGLSICTTAEVEIEPGNGLDVEMNGLSDESDQLVRLCIKGVLDRTTPGEDRLVRVRTTSDIPVSRGLKSSSAAANAVIMATLDALGEQMDPLEAIRIGTKAAIAAKVSVTGAFDDACASLFGGVAITDNRSETLMVQDVLPSELRALIYVPDHKIRKIDLPLDRMRAMKGIVDIAFCKALEGDYFSAMTINGLCYSAALGLEPELTVLALKNGALSAGLSGSGPAVVTLVHEDQVKEFKAAMNGYKFIVTEIYNGKVNE